MAALHVISKPASLSACLEVAAADDTLLLIEDGVYCAAQPQTRSMHVIGSDLSARGLARRVADGMVVISYEDFVDLVAAHQPTVSWA